MSAEHSQRLAPPPSPQSGGTAQGVAEMQNIAAPQAKALARDAFGREIPTQQTRSPFGSLDNTGQAGTKKKAKQAATETLGRRAGALADELDFPAFVSSLVHGTFDAIVDSSIRQMEAYADLISAVSKPLDEFTQENVTLNQARDWMVEQYPIDVGLVEENGGFSIAPTATGDDDFTEAPSWLADYGHENEPLSQEFLEETILPIAREKIAQQRLSSLATMVLMGMQRVIVKDGTIAARLRFRAAAADHAAIEYATNNDPATGDTEWGRRGTRQPAVTKVSTVGVNVQSDSELKAELFGDVKINFSSETIPLERFIDEAQRTLLERHSRQLQPSNISTPPVGSAPIQTPVEQVAQITTPPQQTPSRNDNEQGGVT